MIEQQYITFEFCDFNNSYHCESYIRLLDHYMKDPMGDAEPLNAEKQRLLLEKLSVYPTAFILFVLYDKEIIGFSTLFELFSTFKVKPYLYIHDFVIHSDARGKKLGKAMMDRIIDFAQEKDYCKITLEVREDNQTAKKLYTLSGFEPCQPDMYFWSRSING